MDDTMSVIHVIISHVIDLIRKNINIMINEFFFPLIVFVWLSTIKLELVGLDANGGPCYIGTGCFHRREALGGKIYDKNDCKVDWKRLNDNRKVEESAIVLEETCKVLASCTFEQNTQWGKEVCGALSCTNT